MKVLAIRNRILLATLALALAGTTCHAEEKAHIMGGGKLTCEKWTEFRDKPSIHYQLEQWVHGYVSGVNWSSDKKQSIPADGDATVAFIDKYCKNNPSDALALAAAALVQETGGPKAKHTWKQ